MQKFVKGRTNNHLTWVMVDATDFATPESAVSAATTIKIYGKVRGGTGVNFVSSGTGSLTNDIQHVGASVTGIYTIALAKADLSDASNAWYDQYTIALSATGCARQTLVVDGGIDDSVLLTLSDAVSNAYSAALLGASAASDAYSAALIIQSRLSDLDSRLVSDVSDVLSQLTVVQSMASDAASAATQGNSRVLLVQSRLSDLDSRLTSDVSDVLSQLTVVQSMASDAASAATQGNSRVLLVQSRLSDLDSRLTSDVSDIYSGIVALSAIVSDAHSAANVGASRALLVQSRLSDLDSRLASDVSDIYSLLSDLHSDVGVMSGVVSDIYSAATGAISASDLSDIASAVWARTGSDPTAVVGVTGTMGAKLDWVAMMSRNKLTQTATKQIAYRDDGTTVVASAVVSDDGTTAVRGEFG